MRRTLAFLAYAAAISATAIAQVVQVQPHDNPTDVWGPYFNARKKITFTGYVKGIVKGKPSSKADVQSALLVQKLDGGGMIEVEIGPEWFVNDQQAKLYVGERVQVTGSKLTVDKHEVVVASQVLIRGRGGPVLALRRPNGNAYWMPTVVAEKPAQKVTDATEPVVESDAAQTQPTEELYPPTMLQLDGGRLNVATGAWDGYSNSVTRVNPYLNVVSGPYPFFLYPR